MFVGRSQAILELRQRIAKVAPSHASVFIIGESGVGKEVAAKEIHQLAGCPGRMVARNCATLGEGLIESELFGHERGAFTGAVERHKGIFEQAEGGTVFLDEITEMKPELQAKLLRVLEDHQVIRVGGHAPIPVNVRVIAASNRLPDEAIADGKLRRDLYFRLKVIQIFIPPLRDRPEDLDDLAPHLIREINRDEGKEVEGLDAECLAALRSYSWPGNVRELRNAIHQGVITRERGLLTVGDLPDEIYNSKHSDDQFVVRVGTKLDTVQHELIRRTLEATGGNRTRAADMLGVPRRTFYVMLQRNGFHSQGRRPGGSGGHNPRT